MRMIKWAVWTVMVLGAVGSGVRAEQGKRFVDAKTIFQTNTGYDERIAIAVDGVIVHRHGAKFAKELASWRQKGYVVGRMFFADSDAGNIYWQGKWDGKKHLQDVERNRAGEVVKCAGVRPYMVPTEGWIAYLQAKVKESVQAGAEAILPEEPLAHAFTGYEEAFRALWVQRYGQPWMGQHRSDLARFLTAKLKGQLYLELERRLAERTRQLGRAEGREIGFVLPIHSLYSNVAGELVAPLGASSKLEVDGYIGQIWTGPVNWALAQYSSPQKSFFSSAYVLYDYFRQLTRGSDKRLWLLVDPVEDNPNHSWEQFARWYEQCVVAMLLMEDVERYEVMPWPDRIFLPGYATGGGTPAPEKYRVEILSVTEVLQEIEQGGRWWREGQWEQAGQMRAGDGIGVAVEDSLMWQRHKGGRLDGLYSLLLPLVERGIAASSFMLERADEPQYVKQFSVIVLSYESFKPSGGAWMHKGLRRWVEAGGVLIVLESEPDELDRAERFWWRQMGFDSAVAHLLKELGANEQKSEHSWRLGKGWVIRKKVSPRRFVKPAAVEQIYMPLVREAVAKAGGELQTYGYFCMRRGPFWIVHCSDKAIQLQGTFVDIFDAELAIRDGVKLKPEESGLYRDVSKAMAGQEPAVLHTTHRLMYKQRHDGTVRFELRGPSGTAGVARVYVGSAKAVTIEAVDNKGQPVDVDWRREGTTVLLRFANRPDGVKVQLSCGR